MGLRLLWAPPLQPPTSNLQLVTPNKTPRLGVINQRSQGKAPGQGPRARPQDKRYRLTSPPLALLDGEFSRENQKKHRTKISRVHGSLWASTMEGLESNESYTAEKDARPHGPPEKHSAGTIASIHVATD